MSYGWATHYIKTLKEGHMVTFSAPRGKSMEPKVITGDLVTLIPPVEGELRKKDIVLVKIRSRVYLHLVKAVKGNTYLIGNNRGGINGWVGFNSIYGVVTGIE